MPPISPDRPNKPVYNGANPSGHPRFALVRNGKVVNILRMSREEAARRGPSYVEIVPEMQYDSWGTGREMGPTRIVDGKMIRPPISSRPRTREERQAGVERRPEIERPSAKQKQEAMEAELKSLRERLDAVDGGAKPTPTPSADNTPPPPPPVDLPPSEV